MIGKTFHLRLLFFTPKGNMMLETMGTMKNQRIGYPLFTPHEPVSENLISYVSTKLFMRPTLRQVELKIEDKNPVL